MMREGARRALPANPRLQQSLLDYPVEYDFKIMGLAADDFPEHARRLVAAVVGNAPPERVIVRASNRGKYQSVTVVAVLVSEEQRLAVYQALREDARVVYAL